LHSAHQRRLVTAMAPRAWKKKRPNVAEPTSAADLIDVVVGQLGGDERAFEQRVFLAFHDAVGTALSRHSRPERIVDGTLFVRLDSAAFAHELTLLRAEVVARLKTALGDDAVKTIRTRVGPL